MVLENNLPRNPVSLLFKEKIILVKKVVKCVTFALIKNELCLLSEGLRHKPIERACVLFDLWCIQVSRCECFQPGILVLKIHWNYKCVHVDEEKFAKGVRARILKSYADVHILNSQFSCYIVSLEENFTKKKNIHIWLPSPNRCHYGQTHQGSGAPGSLTGPG